MRVVDYRQRFTADHAELVMKMGNMILNSLKSSTFGLPPCVMTQAKQVAVGLVVLLVNLG